MKIKSHLLVGLTVVFCGKSVGLASAQSSQPPQQPELSQQMKNTSQPIKKIESKNGMLAFNFIDVDVDAALMAISQATGKFIVIDPKVRGAISLKTTGPMSVKQVFDLLSTSLRVRGFTLIESGKNWKVVPEADAKQQGGTVTSSAPVQGNDTQATQVFRLTHESAVNLLPVLKPLMSPSSAISAYGANNSLVITDYVENLQRLSKILAAVDSPIAGEVELISVFNMSANDISQILSKAFDTGNSNSDAGQKVVISADQRTNTLLIKTASAGKLAQVKALVTKLDVKTERNGNIYVIPLKNANATRLAQTLRGLINSSASTATQEKSSSSGTGATQASAGGQSSASLGSGSGSGSQSSISSDKSADSGASGNGNIQADIPSNSLIIIANEVVYRNLIDVVEKLDVRVPQVYVESLFVEVSSESAEEFGVQWQNLVGSSSKIFFGTNFTAAGSNIVSLGGSVNALSSLGNVTTAPTTTLKGGLNLGVLKDFGGVFGLAALARAFESISGVNVLSAPNLVTLDNEEGKIVIGRNVPFITGQYAQTGSASSVSPFQTIERKDVGLTLRFKPQVTSSGLIKLQIFQESSSIVDSSLANTSGIITTKRAIESSVIAEDGQIIALGGLMEDSSNNGAEKVPLLGDIPIVGFLFKNEARKKSKTNLMIFLRPYVIRNAEQSDAITTDRLTKINDIRKSPAPEDANMTIIKPATSLQINK